MAYEVTRFPVLTTTERDAGTFPSGFIILNSTTSSFEKYNGSAWESIGSGGSGDGINLISNGMASSTTGWSLYADAAGTTPVDGTGGTPTGLTFVRNTSSPIDGLADFKLSKDASNRQGGGVSYDFTVGTAFPAGTRMRVQMYFKASASWVSGTSSDTRVYLYDVTNSSLITPAQPAMLYSNGLYRSTFDSRAGSSIRVIVHIATTNASAWDLQFKFVEVGPGKDFVGPAIGDWTAYTPTISGFGTTTANASYYRRVGDSVELSVNFKTGTPAASLGTVSLPPGLTVDANKVRPASANNDSTGVGRMFNNGTSQNVYAMVNSFTSANVVGFGCSQDQSQLTMQNGNAYTTANDTNTVMALIPITGWSSNVAVSPSGVVRISEYLAQGTRVTGSAPTALGEYRSYLRNGSGVSFTETNGAPTATPSIANGIRLYEGNTYASADTNNEPTRYEIFIGRNKSLRLEWYSTTGRTGFIDAHGWTLSASFDYGYFWDYDPATGIFSIVANRTGASSHRSGSDIDGGNFLSDPYFEIYVADNDYQIQLSSTLNQPVYLKDIKSATTNSGTFTSGAWQTRDLNTLENQQPWVSLSANQFVLQAGTYQIETSAPATYVDNHKSKLRNITDSTDTLIGTTEYAANGFNAQTRSFIIGTFTISASKTFELQHRCTTTYASYGFGNPSGYSVNEVYAMVKLVKLF